MYRKNMILSFAVLFGLALVLSWTPVSAQQSVDISFPEAEVVAGCSPTRAEISGQLEAGVTVAEIAAKYADCSGPLDISPKSFTAEKGVQAIIPLNIFFEQLLGCGYDPQSAVLDCTVQLNQQFGYGGVPGGGPGSPQWVRMCWFGPFGVVDEGIFSVHVHDEPFGVAPPWQYGTRVQAPLLQSTLALNGQSVNGYAIHSWLIPAPNCFTLPPLPWGSISTLMMKLDP